MRGRAGSRMKRRDHGNSRPEEPLRECPFSSASFLPHLLNFHLRLVERTDCSMSCSKLVADLAWNPGWGFPVLCPPPLTPPTPARIHWDGPLVEEEPPRGAAAGASSKGALASTSALPAASRQSLAKAPSGDPAP